MQAHVHFVGTSETHVRVTRVSGMGERARAGMDEGMGLLRAGSRGKPSNGRVRAGGKAERAGRACGRARAIACKG
jgi:hypothetical protein